MIHILLLVWIISGVAFSGCTFKATIDTTTDGTTEFVSSTTGKTWWTKEGLVQHQQHAEVFVSVNYDHLLQDIAKGEGEYLFAFGKILRVPAVFQSAFARQLQQHYVDLVESGRHQDEWFVKQFLHQVHELLAHEPILYSENIFLLNT